MLPSANKIYRDDNFLFQQDFAFVQKTPAKWFADHIITELANSYDLNPTEKLWRIVKRKMRNTRPKITAMKATWASVTTQQCHKTDCLHPTLYRCSNVYEYTSYSEAGQSCILNLVWIGLVLECCDHLRYWIPD